MPSLNGKLADPQFRERRARKAAIARTSIDHYVKKIVDAAPELTEDQRSVLAALLRPAAQIGEAA
jgi:hypothetical protein